jgi:hypothetical protein
VYISLLLFEVYFDVVNISGDIWRNTLELHYDAVLPFVLYVTVGLLVIVNFYL